MVVTIRVPEGTGIQIKDYVMGRRVWIKYIPHLRIGELKRFSLYPDKVQVVYSRDLNGYINLTKTIGEQGILEGDKWEIWEILVG